MSNRMFWSIMALVIGHSVIGAFAAGRLVSTESPWYLWLVSLAVFVMAVAGAAGFGYELRKMDEMYNDSSEEKW